MPRISPFAASVLKEIAATDPRPECIECLRNEVDSRIDDLLLLRSRLAGYDGSDVEYRERNGTDLRKCTLPGVLEETLGAQTAFALCTGMSEKDILAIRQADAPTDTREFAVLHAIVEVIGCGAPDSLSDLDTLENISYAITHGDCSGHTRITAATAVDAQTATGITESQGSDFTFFGDADE